MRKNQKEKLSDKNEKYFRLFRSFLMFLKIITIYLGAKRKMGKCFRPKQNLIMRKRMGYYYQGGLNKKKQELNLCYIFSFLIWIKITFLASNFLNFAELVENKLMKSKPPKFYQYSFFYPIYCCLL